MVAITVTLVTKENTSIYTFITIEEKFVNHRQSFPLM